MNRLSLKYKPKDSEERYIEGYQQHLLQLPSINFRATIYGRTTSLTPTSSPIYQRNIVISICQTFYIYYYAHILNVYAITIIHNYQELKFFFTKNFRKSN